jgi:acetylornithine deacetylase/succinyl-diaminopimelate desuccinylase-like protein
MTSTTPPVDMKTAEDHLMRFLAVEGLSGQEKAIGEVIINELKKVGVPASAIRFDKVHERIPVPTQTGNLFVDLPGTRKGPRLLFITHLDTVPLPWRDELIIHFVRGMSLEGREASEVRTTPLRGRPDKVPARSTISSYPILAEHAGKRDS